MYGRDLGPEGEDFVFEERFDKIRFYLKHNKYPDGADRAEKSRLRSAATHYRLVPVEGGEEKLMLKDKEVVSDPQRQYEIARTTHALQHGGINKTTAAIAEQYHWVRIKETVSLAIKNCPQCKEPAKDPLLKQLDENGIAVSQPMPPAPMGPRRGRSQHFDRQKSDPVMEGLSQLLDVVPPPAIATQERNNIIDSSSEDNLRALQEHLNSGLVQHHSLDHFEPENASTPLDPRIMASSNHDSGRHYPEAHDTGFTQRGSHRHDDPNAQFELDFNDGSGQPPERFHRDVHTGLATQRHVQDHDDPMTYVVEGRR